MDGAHLVVAQPGIAGEQPELVQGEPGLHLDRERARDDLEVELPAVAVGDLVEGRVAVGDHPGEDVEAAGRALRVRLRADARPGGRAPRSAARDRAGRARASRRRGGRSSGTRCRRSCPRPSTRCPAGSCSGAPRRTRRAAGRGSRAARSPAGSGRGRTGSTRPAIAWRRRCAGKTPGSARGLLAGLGAGRDSRAGSLIVAQCRRRASARSGGATGTLAGHRGWHPGEVSRDRVVSVRSAAAVAREVAAPWVALALLVLVVAGRADRRRASRGRRRRSPPTTRRSRASRSRRAASTRAASPSPTRSGQPVPVRIRAGKISPLGKLAGGRAARRPRDRAPVLAGRLARRRDRARQGDDRHADHRASAARSSTSPRAPRSTSTSGRRRASSS